MPDISRPTAGHLLQWLIGLLLLTACMPTSINSTPYPNANILPQPTVPPPPWVQSSAPISLDNAANVATLGRLDQPSTPSTVFAFSVSPNTTRLAGLNNDELLIWNLIDGTLLAHTSRSGGTKVFFSPDKTSIYTVTPKGEINTYDAETARSGSTIQGHGNYDNVAAYDADDGFLALGGQNGEIKIWDLLARVSKVTLNAHRLRVAALAFSPDGSRLISAGDEGVVTIWDWDNRAHVADIQLTKGSQATQVIVSPGGSEFAVTTANTVYTYALADGKPLQTMAMGTGGAALVFAYSTDGRYIATGGDATELTLWNAETGKLFAKLPGTQGDKLAAAFSPDGTLLLTSAMGVPTRLWNLAKVTQAGIDSAELPATNARILASRWTDDSRLLLLFEATGSVEVWGIGALGATATP